MCLYVRTSSDPSSRSPSDFSLCLLKLIAAVISNETEKNLQYELQIRYDNI
jgi:hypothetical protein